MSSCSSEEANRSGAPITPGAEASIDGASTGGVGGASGTTGTGWDDAATGGADSDASAGRIGMGGTHAGSGGTPDSDASDGRPETGGGDGGECVRSGCDQRTRVDSGTLADVFVDSRCNAYVSVPGKYFTNASGTWTSKDLPPLAQGVAIDANGVPHVAIREATFTDGTNGIRPYEYGKLEGGNWAVMPVPRQEADDSGVIWPPYFASLNAIRVAPQGAPACMGVETSEEVGFGVHWDYFRLFCRHSDGTWTTGGAPYSMDSGVSKSFTVDADGYWHGTTSTGGGQYFTNRPPPAGMPPLHSDLMEFGESSIAVTPTGRVYLAGYVLYCENTAPGCLPYHLGITLSEGATGRFENTLLTEEAGVSYDVAVAASGDVHVFWIVKEGAGANTIRHARRRGSAWTTTDLGRGKKVAATIDRADRLHVVTQDLSDGIDHAVYCP